MNDDKKYHYIYRITNNIDSKYYIGIHSTNNINDGYMGSGTHLKYAQQKYGVKNFIKDILEFAASRKKILMREIDLVTEAIVNDSKTYNKVVGGGGTGKPNSMGTRCFIEDKEYNSFNAASRDTGYSSDIINRMHVLGFKQYSEYQKYIKKTNTAHICCTIHGTNYTSITEASNITGISYQTIRRMIDANITTIDEYNKLCIKNRSLAQIGTKCVINGINYNSIAMASKHIGVAESVIINMLRHNISEYEEYHQLYGKTYKKNIGSSIVCTINNKDYNSLIAASNDTGLSVSIIRRMIKENIFTYDEYNIYKRKKRRKKCKITGYNKKKCIINNKIYSSIIQASNATGITKYEISIMRDNNITSYKKYNIIKNIDKCKVMCYIEGKKYNTIAAASRDTNISRHKIRRMINAGINTFKEYEIWIKNKE